MAKKIQRKKSRTQRKISESPFNIYWDKQNYLLLLSGFVFLLLGFYFLAQGPWDSFSSLVISPVLLFIAYIFIFPASILYRKKKTESNKEEKEITSNS